MQKQIIYILGNYRVGAADGLAEFNYQTTYLLKEEFDFNFIEFNDNENKTFYETKQVDNFKIHVFGSKSLPGYRIPPLFITWLKEIKTGAIFHLSHIYNLRNYATAKILVSLSIPYLITPHDSFVYHKNYGKEKLILKQWYRKIFIKFFDKYVFDHAKLIHGISPACFEDIKLITKTPVQIVYNQVNDTGILYDSNIIEKQVCFIGRFDMYRKGIDIAITAFSLFKKNHTDVDLYKYKLIGPADEKAKKMLQQLCLTLQLRENDDLVFTGKIPVKERDAELAKSKMYMQLSRTEGFGLSVVQALSFFKPVIISTHIPIGNKIISYKAGFVVNNENEAAEAIKKIDQLSDKEYEAMCWNARNCYLNEFHPKVIKLHLVNMYNKVIENKIV